jgi:signal transduction histidine kinase
VLLATNLLVLILPLAGLWFLRLYESALIRQTETELVAQSAVLSGAFHAEWRHHARQGGALQPGTSADGPAATADVPAAAASAPAATADPTVEALVRRDGLDLARDPILPPAPDPLPPARPGPSAEAGIGTALAPILSEAQPITLAAIRILDTDGVIIASTGRDLGLSLAGLGEVQQALQGQPVDVLRRRSMPPEPRPVWLTRAAGLLVFVAVPVRDGDAVIGAVLLSRTPSTVMQAVWGKRVELGFLTGGLLLVGTLLALGTSRLITRPVDALIVGARTVAEGRPGDLVPPLHAGTREIAELFTALASMAATLQQRATYISGFAAHVSHEFKTPLAGARGAAELLADHGAEMTQDERAHFLGVINDSVVRLDRLVRGLLDLARADMMRPLPSVVTAVGPVLETVAARYRERGLTVRVASADLRAGLAAGALEAMLLDLLENVVVHAGADATVDLSAAAAADGGVCISVRDNGPGISTANVARLFDPFFTTRRTTGTGLGLAIARAMAISVGGNLDLAVDEPGRGACFALQLPGVPMGWPAG